MVNKLSVFILLFIPLGLFAQHIEILQQGLPTSIRGLSVVDDSIAWVSGSSGHIAKTTNGGQTWNWKQVKGFEKADFRDIEAFSAKEAIIMSSGTPALILKTTDGGISWTVKYKNNDTAYFLDAMTFSDAKHGYILGDPINDKFLLLESKDAGESWHESSNNPVALPGEAAFAASGTCLNLTLSRNIVVVTGGTSAGVNMLKTDDKWYHYHIPIVQGKSSQGAFSVSAGAKQMVIVGGDYQHDNLRDSTACYSTDNGLTWHLSITPPFGFQSCVEYIKNQMFLATGTSGSNITTNGAKTWVKIDHSSYNVCRKAKNGKLILLAGNGGKIGILKP